MKRRTNQTWKILGTIVVALSALLLAGCGGAGAGGGSELTQEQAAQAAAEAFGYVDSAYDEVPPTCIELEYGDTQTTITFNNCVFDEITVNGSMTVSSMRTQTTSSGSLTLAGAGLPASPLTVSWSLLIVSEPPSISGQISVGGTTYTYDELGIVYEY